VLLLDEPLGALDQKVRRRMQVELKRIHREVGITFIHVTHDQEEALAMADRIAVMADGRIEQLADSLEVYTRPATPFVAGFVGEANRFAGAAETNAIGVAALKVTGSQTLRLPATAGIAAGTQVEVFVRPERVRFAPVDSKDMTVFEGTVRAVAFLGESARCYVELDGGAEVMAMTSAAEMTRGDIPPVGTRVRIGWPVDAAVVFTVGSR
jgi:spermidine/putrescine transport system ATP-binding protein